MLSSIIIGAIVMGLLSIYIWSKLYNEKINFKSKRLYIGFISMILLIILYNLLSIMYIKILTSIVVLSVMNWYIFRKNLKVTIIGVLFFVILLMIAETFFSLIVLILFSKDGFQAAFDSYFGSTISNVVIAIIAYILSYFKIVNKLYKNTLNYTNKINISQFLLILAILVISYNLLFFTVYNKSNILIAIIINTVTTIVYAFIVFKIVETQNNYLTIFMKYNNSLDSLKEYEKMIDLYRVSNHENKNQLLTIRNMFKEKNKNVSNYIDTVIDNKLKDDEKIIRETVVIPEGGLRAVIYSKLLDMKNKDINYNLSVDKKVKAVQLIELNDDVMLDICRIIGVFLDNAIDAVSNLNQAVIDMRLHMNEEKLSIIISNNFEGVIDIDKLDDRKYTTKGEGHGYGLSLVKQIIDKNARLENIKKINDDVFTQELQIKM